MPKKKTLEDFKKDVFDLVGNDYEVVGEYLGHTVKICMRHCICGNEYMVKPKAFMWSDNRCPICYGTPRKTTEEFKQEIYNLVGDEYTLVGEYVTAKIKVRLRHNICGNEYLVKPSNFTTPVLQRRCPYCFGNFRRTTEQFKQEIFDLVGDEYTVLGEYKSNDEYIAMVHNKCGYHFDVYPSSFTSAGTRCAKCAGREKKDTESFKNEVRELVGNEYSVLGEYVNTHRHLLIRHNTCGNEYKTAPSNFLAGRRCPKCAIKINAENRRGKFINPNISPEDRLVRRLTAEYGIWRKEVKIKDNFTCLYCKSRGGPLEAHHLNAWSAYPEQRYDVNNGATLCRKCHRNFHKLYGKTNNTREQFEDWIANKQNQEDAQQTG